MTNELPRPREDAATKWSLAVWLTASFAVSAFILVLIASLPLYFALARKIDNANDQYLAEEIQILRNILNEHHQDTARLAEEIRSASAARQYVQVYLRIARVDGTPVAETPRMIDQLPPDLFPGIGSAGAAEMMKGRTVQTAGDDSFRLMACWASTTQSDDNMDILLQVALNRSRDEALLAFYRGILSMVLASTVVVCGFSGHRLAKRATDPIRQMTKTAATIDLATLGERIKTEKLPGELGELAEVFNAMLARLERSFFKLSQFTSDVAHELRTPANNLRTAVEVTLRRERTEAEYRDALNASLDQLTRLAELIDGLLFLARAEHPQTNVELAPLHLDSDLHSIQEFYEPAATDQGVHLSVRATTGLVLQVNRPMIHRAIGNLVENALAHTAAGGSIEVSAVNDNGLAVVSVSDTGSGISSEHISHICDRFYRADCSRASNGTHHMGLGLAIVNSIMELHAGSLRISSEVDKGTRVELCFPISSSGIRVAMY